MNHARRYQVALLVAVFVHSNLGLIGLSFTAASHQLLHRRHFLILPLPAGGLREADPLLPSLPALLGPSCAPPQPGCRSAPPWTQKRPGSRSTHPGTPSGSGCTRPCRPPSLTESLRKTGRQNRIRRTAGDTTSVALVTHEPGLPLAGLWGETTRQME